MSTPPLEKPRSAEAVQIPVGNRTVTGDLAIPERARALVIFAHGSGSSRMSPRNRQIADVLDRAGIATLLVDLLTEEEEDTDTRTGRHRFDMTLLASRLVAFGNWAQRRPELLMQPMGLFGASTGAGAALLAAAQQPRSFRAVVARGGRPDLAGSALRRVLSPTLLIVGQRDEQALDINLRAAEGMLTEVRVEIVPGATHFFEEPGALAQVAQLTREWFRARLIP
jgi:putative phosphoribosyl transferase